MSRRFAVVCLVVALGAVRVAVAQEPAAPRIASWSNSKTGDKKTVFQVKPGEKITFRVKSEGAEKYLWLVDGKVVEGAEGASFQWTVPGKGMWKVCVKTTNKAREKWALDEQKVLKEWIGRISNKNKYKKTFVRDMIDWNVYPFESRKEWIVSTSFILVKPGESIQKAIDSIPPEGGIVELASGIHEVSDTLYPPGTFIYKYKDKEYRFKYSILVNRSNVTIYGAHDSIVRHHNNGVSCFLVADLENTAPPPRLENITFRGFSTASTYTRGRNSIISAKLVRNFTVEDIHDTSGASDFVSAGAWIWKYGKKEGYSENIFYKGNVVKYGALYGSCCRNVYQINNTTIKCRRGWSALGMERATKNMHIIGNRIGGAINASITVFAQGGPYNVRNNVCKDTQRGIWIGSGVSDVLLIDNIITRTTQTGILSFPQYTQYNNLIISNKIYNNSGHGLVFIQYKKPGRIPHHETDVVNNVIYNNDGDGIRINGKDWSDLKVTDNIIANNKGYGINRIEGNVTHSYNDVWNNAKGNYKGCSAGEGDFSKDPLFANPLKGDFHLKSKAGRWDPKTKNWVKDKVQSPCIDAGDPKADFSMEPAPNGGRVNMGAYGNTKEASKSEK